MNHKESRCMLLLLTGRGSSDSDPAVSGSGSNRRSPAMMLHSDLSAGYCNVSDWSNSSLLSLRTFGSTC